MPAVPSIDPQQARAHLADHLGRDPGVVDLVGQGEWSRCFGFRDGGRDLVVRFGYQSDDFEKDRRAAAWSSSALPVPKVLHIARLTGGVHMAVSERIDGTPLEALDRPGWEAVLPSLLAALGKIWRTDVGDTTGFGRWDASDQAPHATWRNVLLAVADDPPVARTHGWAPQLASSPVGDDAFRRGVQVLDELTGTGAGAPERRLVHSDLINRNVHVADDRIAGVFDWGCALYGDPLYDVAWLDVYAPWHPPMDQLDLRSLLVGHMADIGVDVTDADARIRASQIHILLASLTYCAHEGRTDDLVGVHTRLLPLLDG